MRHPSILCNSPVKALATGVALMASVGLHAADHREAPNARAQLPADIGDYYAWHEGDQLNLVLTFGTFAQPGEPASYDASLLYGFHFDTDEVADGISDIDMYVRFAQDVDGNWGLQVSDSDDTPVLSGPVETVLTEDDMAAYAGLVDDPFFFDQTGFNATLDTGALSFDNTRDDVAGLNITAIVLQVPVDDIVDGGGSFQTWATSASQ